MPKVQIKSKSSISVTSYVIVLIFYIQMSMHENFIWIMSFKAGVFRHARPWSKCSKITNNQYLKKELSYCLNILYTVRDSRKLQINLVMLVDCSQACFGIPKVRRNNGSAISGKSDCLGFFASSSISMETVNYVMLNGAYGLFV